MRKRIRSFWRMLPAAIVVALPAAGSAQDGFLFEAPKFSVHLRLGAAVPNAGGDLFNLITDELTLERSDFSSGAIGGDLAIVLSNRMDVVLSASSSSVSRRSESRDWVDLDDEPIEQTTRFRRTPVTVGLKYHLRERGREIGSHAWVPNSVLPYVGAAGGLTWYRIHQAGDFVDEATLDIFAAQYTSTGSAKTGQIFGGVEYWTSTVFGISIEGRYQFASGALKGDFQPLNDIDLRGFQLMAGAAIRL